jgi:parallel beta-helix repeat protein
MHSRSITGRKAVLIAFALLVVAIAVLVSYVVESVGVPPRRLAPYIEHRVSQHNPVIVHAGEWLAHALLSLDRGDSTLRLAGPLRIGAQVRVVERSASLPEAQNTVHVDSTEKALSAIADAEPGRTIVFAPGIYRFHGANIAVTKPGTSQQPIVVRAERPGSVVLELETAEGFWVTAPYWTFENLVVRGVCRLQSSCEHAFHVVGGAHHFVARNNTIVDFDAHFKINGASGQMPDDGLIEGNTLTNTSVRNTDHPVTLIDLVAASRWKIRRNLITDFVKGGSDKISYGAFVKGGGSDNRLEQNLVICENRLRGAPGQRVGLSLGGGGTGKSYCRDHRCITEQDHGVIASNLIASCSDDGIYINRGAGSTVTHNTLIDTGGIVVRFPESSADVAGNLVDASIRSRDEGILRGRDNIETPLSRLFFGLHPVRRLFVDNPLAVFQWAGQPPRRGAVDSIPLDLCGTARPQNPTYGTFEDFSACVGATATP